VNNTINAVSEYLGMAENGGDLATTRSYYDKANQALYAFIQSGDSKTSNTYYVNHCPMYTENRGYWIDTSPEILNPYHGSVMLTCGSNKMSLK
jgi:hypothetical protein